MRRPDGFVEVRERHAAQRPAGVPVTNGQRADRLLFRYHPERGVVELREGGRLLQVDLTSLQASGDVVE